MIEVTLPDGTIAEFPDGTSYDTIKAALQRHTQASAGVSDSTRPPPLVSAPADLFGGAREVIARSHDPRVAASQALLPTSAMSPNGALASDQLPSDLRGAFAGTILGPAAGLAATVPTILAKGARATQALGLAPSTPDTERAISAMSDAGSTLRNISQDVREKLLASGDPSPLGAIARGGLASATDLASMEALQLPGARAAWAVARELPSLAARAGTGTVLSALEGAVVNAASGGSSTQGGAIGAGLGLVTGLQGEQAAARLAREVGDALHEGGSQTRGHGHGESPAALTDAPGAPLDSPDTPDSTPLAPSLPDGERRLDPASRAQVDHYLAYLQDKPREELARLMPLTRPGSPLEIAIERAAAGPDNAATAARVAEAMDAANAGRQGSARATLRDANTAPADRALMDAPTAPLALVDAPTAHLASPPDAPHVPVPGAATLDLPPAIPPTAAQTAIVNAERAAHALSPIEAALRRDWPTAFDAARTAVDSGALDPRVMATSLSHAPRSLNDHEVAALTYDRMRIHNEHAAVSAQVEQAMAAGDKVGETEGRLRLATLEEARNLNDHAIVRSGTEQGRGLNARRMMVAQDYSLPAITQKARIAAAGKPIPPKIAQSLTAIAARVAEATTALAHSDERAATRAADLALRRIAKDVAFDVRRVGRAATRDQLAAEWGQLSHAFRAAAATPRMGLDPALVNLMRQMARNRVQLGITNGAEVVDHIYQVTRDHIDNLTPRDVRDAISGYGQSTAPTSDQLTRNLRDAHRQMRLLSRLEDVQAGERPARTGYKRPTPSAITADLETRVRDAMRQVGVTGADDATRQAAYKARLASSIRDMEARFRDGNFTPRERPPALILDPESRQLRAHLDQLKSRADEHVARLALTNRTPYERALDLAAKWPRELLLSGTQTLGKLTGAAVGRSFVTTPVEEALGSLLAHMPGLRDIAADAPREGYGLNLHAEARAFAQLFNREMWADTQTVRRTGRSALEIYSDRPRAPLPPELQSFVGQLHGMLKTPTEWMEFHRALEQRAAHAIRNGADVSDPAIQSKLASAALVDGKRAILMSDHMLVDGWRGLVNIFDSMGKPGTARGAAGKSVATALRTVFPIVKVPINYSSEITSYAFGGPKALGRVLWSKASGEPLGPDGSDYVMRNLKKWGPGLALLATGYMNDGAIQAGGYYSANDKRDPADVPAGGLRLFGHEVPRFLVHTPALEMLQIGATLRRVHDHYSGGGVSNGGQPKPGMVAEGARRVATGLAETVPFYEEALRGGQASETTSGVRHFAGDFLRARTLPPDLQQAARVLDQDQASPNAATSGPQLLAQLAHLQSPATTKRYTRDISDEMKLGIPGLRQQVPTETERDIAERAGDAGSNLPPATLDELKRLDVEIGFSAPRVMNPVTSQPTSMAAGELRLYRQLVGTKEATLLAQLLSDPTYATLDDEARRKAIASYVDVAKSYAKMHILSQRYGWSRHGH